MEPGRFNFKQLAILFLLLCLLAAFIPRSSSCKEWDESAGQAIPPAGPYATERGTASPPGGFSAAVSPSPLEESICLPEDGGYLDAADASRFDRFAEQVIDTVIVTGNKRTKRITVVRIMASKQGDPLVPGYIERDSAFLYGLGFFSQVDISVRKTGRSRCIVTVQLKERPDLFMKYPYPTLDYDFEKGVSFGVRWKVKNFRGYGEQIGFEFKKRRDEEHGGSASWYVPWVFGRRMRMNASVFNYRRLEEPESDDFIKSRTGVRLGYGVPLNKSLVRQVWLTPALSFETRRSRLSIPGNVNYPAGISFRQNLISMGFSFMFDSRNQRIVPTSGLYDIFYMSHIFSVNGLDQQYTFYRFEHRNYLTVGRLGTLVFALDLDTREGDLPDFYRMGLGGESTVRGYSSAQRGKSRVLGTMEWRKRIFGPRVYDIPRIGSYDVSVNLTAFVDTGALADRMEDLEISGFHSAYGGGIEIISPLQDIIKLEVAGDGYGNGGLYFVSGSRF